ncbi:MAG: helix-turn-helix domain-containing protein [Polyangiales bacterium]
MAPAVSPWLRYVAANVRRLRAKAGLTQEELGERAEIEPRYLQDVEHARTNLSFAIFVRLATALDVDPRRLLRPAQMPPTRAGRPPAKRSR